MKPRFTISLQNRLALTYALFISLSLGVLILFLNHFSSQMFNSHVRENIAAKSREIVNVISGQYNQERGLFDVEAVRAMGLFFAQEGYIIILEDERGNMIWDTRARDRMEYLRVMRGIAARMEVHRLPRGQRSPDTNIGEADRSLGGSRVLRIEPPLFPEDPWLRDFGEANQLQREQYAVFAANRQVGTLSIDTFGPLFYSEAESAFLQSLNRLLFLAGMVLLILSVVISVLLSRAIARPIRTVGEAAQRIARSRAPSSGEPSIIKTSVRVEENYYTRELAELSQSINKLAEDLEEGERRQKQLSSDVAHELRSPLSCLQGTLEAMIDGVYPPNQGRLESCHEEVMRLTRLVDDLDVLTGLEWNSISLDKTEFDLGGLIESTIEPWRSAALEKGISITCNMEKTLVYADYSRLKQVFFNLLSNAIKYTDQGSIDIRVQKVTLASGPVLEISICDTGIGIPEEDLPRIFERFYRSDKSRNRSTGGAGIGLSIAAAIISAHGGSISAEQNPQGGSIFIVTLKESPE
ncbi:MAG: ATP-binding protein [Treponema sp.]|nr:ATP-binding protein [Treponema sp.]